MLKKIFTVAFTFIMLTSLLSGCGSYNSSGSATSTEKDNPVTIKMFISTPSLLEPVKEYIVEYKKVKPNVTIELQMISSDYPTILKTKIASGEMPDVFQTTTGSEIKQYAEYSADLTNEPLTQAMTDAVKTSMSLDDKVIALPTKLELFALIYNKDLFASAGINEVPKTMTELEADCVKLQEKGITPFANGYKEWWEYKQILQHFINASSTDPQKLVNDFIAGKTTFKDNPILLKYFDYIDLTVKYGGIKTLEGDYAAQLRTFATGEAAIMNSANDGGAKGVTKISPDINIGVMGYPVNDDASNSIIIVGPTQVLRINKDSKVLQETKDLFNWLYTSEYGKKWFSDVAKVIPPITNGSLPDTKMVMGMQEILKTQEAGVASMTYSLDSFNQKLGEITQGYIGKKKTKEQAIDEIQKAWIQLGGSK